jgi:DNA-binding GntR family transcriptional regulator
VAIESGLPDLLSVAPALAGGYTTKQDFVACLLREAIVTGRLPPGQRLRQEDVSRQLRLSWTPVREAFRQLEAEGWVAIEHHRGAVVAPLELVDFEEIYLLRLANEPLAARLSVESADGRTVATMARLVKQMGGLNLARRADWVRFLQLEREFHEALYQAAGRPRLFALVMSLRYAAERYLRASFAIDDEPLQHRQVHADLLEACRNHDGAKAEATMRRALERVLNVVRPLVRGLQEPDGR